MVALTFPWMPILISFAVFFFLVVFFKSFVVVGGTEIAVLERKYLGRDLPQGASWRRTTRSESRRARSGPGCTC